MIECLIVASSSRVSGRTPKAAASENGHWEIVEILTPRVGGFGDLQRFDFEGAKTFPAEALRRALQLSSDFFEISHPLGPQDAYLEAVERKLRSGYQHAGFPEAQVTVRADAKAGRVRVKVTEGPRYLCGGVKVTGAQKMPAALIVQELTAAPASRIPNSAVRVTAGSGTLPPSAVITNGSVRLESRAPAAMAS